MLRLVQFVLSEGRTGKKAAQDRLADVEGVHEATEIRIGQADADRAANLRLVLPNQIRCRLIVSGAYAPDEIAKGLPLSHAPASCKGLNSRSLYPLRQ